MTTADINTAIRSRFKTQVEDGYPLDYVVYDNGDPPDKDDLDMWVRFSVRIASAEQIDMAAVTGRTHRSTGVAIANIFTKPGSGTFAAEALAAAIEAAFRSQKAGGILYRAPSTTHRGRGNDAGEINISGPWHVSTVTIPFTSDELF